MSSLPPAPLPPPAPPAVPPAAVRPAGVPPSPVGDAADLIDRSRPRPTPQAARQALLAVVVLAVVALLLGARPGLVLTLIALAMLAASTFVSMAGAALRREQRAIDAAEAFLALRRTHDAAVALAHLMGRPMRAAEHRLRAMLLLGGVLARLDRPDDAVAVYDALLGDERLAGPGAVLAKLGRATALLAADRLYDADRAIADLRRVLGSAPSASDPAVARPALAGLRLVELHRDVKTNHLDDALALFELHLPVLRRGLGHRVADAYALAAVALHRTGRPADAAARFAAATALAPLSDLVRRYPDVWPLTQAYPATPPPGSP